MLEDFRLKVFIAVADEGSFTRAARTLGISQPAVSQNVSELEKELGAELFLRRKGAVSLTPSGSAFREYAARILHWCSVAEEVFSSDVKTSSPVTIAADSYSAGCILPSVLESLLSINPGLSFKVVTDVSAGSPDLLLACRPHSAEMSLEDGDTLVGSFYAVAVSDNTELVTRRTIPPGIRLAVWTPYLPLLPLDLKSKVVIDSPYTSFLAGLSLPDVVVLLPGQAAYTGLNKLNLDLSFLRMDLHAVPSEGFAAGGIYGQLINLLKTFL
ncbi:MAG: LysR family transcriptional regulator [Bacteroidales bacterium]|nr:LysR family transcriptional regulator [Bacteroidales bacterium]